MIHHFVFDIPSSVITEYGLSGHLLVGGEAAMLEGASVNGTIRRDIWCRPMGLSAGTDPEKTMRDANRYEVSHREKVAILDWALSTSWAAARPKEEKEDTLINPQAHHGVTRPPDDLKRPYTVNT